MSRLSSAPDHEVAIVGAGLSGLGAAMTLSRVGVHDVIILERADNVGGTWRDNTYPGVQVDSPSLVYQFPFELRPQWSRMYPYGAEIMEYIDDLFDKYELRDRTRLGTEVLRAIWDDDDHLWRIETSAGSLTARFLITALGIFSAPKSPDIPGLKDFPRPVIHTSEWDHSCDLAGKRVAVIGTGASGIQVAPAIAQVAERLYVHQRTPIWMLPRFDPRLRRLTPLFRVAPVVQKLVGRVFDALVDLVLATAVLHHKQLPFLLRIVEAVSRGYMRTQISDPVLRAKLTPRYGFVCKFPGISSNYLAMFQRENTELVTEGIECITDTGIRTNDGVEREVDVIVLATGFHVTDSNTFPSLDVAGRDGLDLRAFWTEHGKQAYEGVSVPSFPNHFMIVGPHSLTGSAWMPIIDAATHHAARVIGEAERRGATSVEIKREAHDRFFREVIDRLVDTPYGHPTNCAGSNSFLVDEHGDAPIIRPSTTGEMIRRSRRFDLENYRFQRVGKPEHAAGRHLSGADA
jgi:cation diffusion facilitator CzcD-associated flavoprotein CzcO